jgi:chaperonin GroES
MWQPKPGVVFVRKDANKTVTDGGIVLPNPESSLTLEGSVTHTSDQDSWMDGVKVLFSKFSGSEVKVGSESLLIMRTDDILAIWQGEKDGDFNV